MAGQIGRLRHRITIQQATVSRDSTYGQAQQAWADVATVWGNIEPETGREYVQASQIVADANCVIRIRYYPGILPTMRAVEGSDIYDILEVRDMYGRGRWMDLFCRSLPVSTVIPSVRITSTGARRVTSTGSIRITA